MSEHTAPAVVMLTGIRLYKRFLSPLLPPACRFQPSCSMYAMEAIEIHGAARGAALAAARIARCHPWNPGGYDPVPRAVIGPHQSAPPQSVPHANASTAPDLR